MQRLFLALLLISRHAFGQNAQATISASLNNVKTSKHVGIPGTKLYIVPPKGFKVNTKIHSFEKDDSTMIISYDYSHKDYMPVALFSKEVFETKSGTIVDYRDIVFNGYSAKYVSMQNSSNILSSNYVVFGDSTFTMMVTGISKSNDTETRKAIVESLGTLYYDADKKEDPYEYSFFTINDRKSKFKYRRHSNRDYMYTEGGRALGETSCYCFVNIFPETLKIKETAESVADRFINGLRKDPPQQISLKNISKEKINGYDAYQAEVYRDSTNFVYYLCVIMNGEKAVVIEGTFQGSADNERATSIDEFKKLAMTIQME